MSEKERLNLRLNLRPLRGFNLKKIYRWRNDPFIMARTRQWRMLEWKEHENWFNNLDPNKNLMFEIVVNREVNDIAATGSCDTIIGVCGLTNIDWVNRSCELSIYIGEENCRRCGYGSKVIAMLKKICFDQMNMHRLWAEVYSFNKPMMVLFRKCGFGEEGYLRDTVYRDGKYYDSWFYNFLEDAWEEGIGTEELLEDE